MWIDLDEIWPSTKELVGVQFASADDFERCQALLAERQELFSELYPETLTAAVRKVDTPTLAAAGLVYREFQLRDMDDLPPERARQIERALIDEWMPHFVERLRREQ
jgi:hypothetical protein